MRLLIYLLLGLTCSCSAKRKLTSNTRMDVHKQTEYQRVQERRESAQSYQWRLDSSNRSNWLKVYPRDVFVINSEGFMGRADSLVWYGDSRQLSKYQQAVKKDQEQLHSETSKSTELSAKSELKTNVLKAGTSIWWILGGFALLALGLVYCRRFLMRRGG